MIIVVECRPIPSPRHRRGSAGAPLGRIAHLSTPPVRRIAGRLGADRRSRTAATCEPGLRRPHAVRRGRHLRRAAGGSCAGEHRCAARTPRPAGRPAGPALAPAPRRIVGVVPAVARRGLGGDLGIQPPAISAQAKARRPACCACSTTCSWPAWRWSFSPTMHTCSWWRGRRWRCLRTSWSPPTIASRKSAAQASCTC